jgi:hypothetical protein
MFDVPAGKVVVDPGFAVDSVHHDPPNQVFRNVAGLKTWLMVGIITAIVVYGAGMLSRSRAAREK